MTTVSIPDLSLVVLVGISGSGKSTFAAQHFGPFETVSSDFCRGLVSNDPNSQRVTGAAFDLLTDIVSRRLRAGLLTVVDATSLKPEDRAELVRLAREHDVLPCAIVLDVPLQTALERHRMRTDRPFDESVLHRQHAQLRKGLRRIGREKFRGVTVLDSDEAIASARIERTPLRSDLREHTGPFDIIGDVHGCLPELRQLLTTLGYRISADGSDACHPEGRTAVFVGDLVDRGPDSVGVLRLVMGMHAAGHALCVPGNHEAKLVRALDGRNVTLSHGLERTMAELELQSEEFRRDVRDFADSLVAHLVLDGGRVVVAHAGLKEEYHNRASGRVREFALYGDTTGETDEFGLPVRLDWAADYRGDAMVVYGHVPTPRAEWVNNTLCLDTGCVFGGQLSALRYPEKEIVSVPAQREWYPPVKPLDAGRTAEADRPLRIGDALDAEAVDTSRAGRVRVPPERAAAALETMSRFAAQPELLPYLPPTMAPAPTSHEEGYLEHPRTALDYYAKLGQRVICEEKHMGSRAVAMLVRPGARVAAPAWAPEHSEADTPLCSYVYTRTGRLFFTDETEDAEFADRAAVIAEAAGLFDRLDSDWVLLDGEILPWNLKAQGLIDQLYRPAAAAGLAETEAVGEALRRAETRGVRVLDGPEVDGTEINGPEVDGTEIDGPGGDGTETSSPAEVRTREQQQELQAFRTAVERYVADAGEPQFAVFQILATAGRTWHEEPHDWHMELADSLASAAAERAERDAGQGAPLFRGTSRIVVDPADDRQVERAVEWWTDLTERGGEGMVVKPLANSRAGLETQRIPPEDGRHEQPAPSRRQVQPGLKVRGREYLRMIYGPDYDRPERLAGLRSRSLKHKQSLALREYALGLESLDRAAAGEPLHRVHLPVFAVLALESDPVDPRL